MKVLQKPVLVIATAALLAGCSSAGTTQNAGVAGVNLSPAAWPKDELEKYWEIENAKSPGNPEAVGYKGAITGSYHGLAQRAGFEALQQGGTSVDAAMTTAMTQIALNAGSVTSYFGIMTMVHYDAATGEVTSMNAGWNTVQGETDPASIPGTVSAETVEASLGTGEPSGRTALVGGFMKGVEAAHGRYGKLPYESLFEPAIYLAEEGFPLMERISGYIDSRKPNLARLPETKAVFTSDDGEWYQTGHHFKQPALAKTLRALATEGSDYMYKGPWAEKLIAAVQADGGKMTMQDLADYEVMWVDPVVADHAGYTVFGNGVPSLGGVNMIEALHLADAAGIAEQGHWSENGESLREAVTVTLNFFFDYLPPEVKAALFPGVDFSPEGRVKRENAQAIWEIMQAVPQMTPFASEEEVLNRHSDTVVVVDQWGNMTAIVHTLNAMLWGRTAINIDGVSITDAVVNQKPIVVATPPGARLPDPTEAGLLVKDGEPVLAFSSMAAGLHQQTFQSLFNVMHFGMTPKEALDAPAFGMPRPLAQEDSTIKWLPVVLEGEFPREVLDDSGFYVFEVPEGGSRHTHGLWVGIARDPETGELRAGSHPYVNGRAIAH